jgi:hypothetical protein
MRRLLLGTAAGLLLTPLVGLALARGSELTGAPASGPMPKVLPPTPVKPVPIKPAPPPPAKDKGETCGAFGTSVDFVDTPSEAARIAKKEEKLVFVLHVSGNFEDPRFT